jgi:hypothetical protein
MRRPVDNLSIEVAMARSFRPMASRAIFALILVLITVIRVSLIGLRVNFYGFLTSLTSLTSDYLVLLTTCVPPSSFGLAGIALRFSG